MVARRTCATMNLLTSVFCDTLILTENTFRSDFRHFWSIWWKNQSQCQTSNFSQFFPSSTPIIFPSIIPADLNLQKNVFSWKKYESFYLFVVPTYASVFLLRPSIVIFCPILYQKLVITRDAIGNGNLGFGFWRGGLNLEILDSAFANFLTFKNSLIMCWEMRGEKQEKMMY